MSDEQRPWWEHAMNALVAGYSMNESRKRAAAEQAEAEREARRRQRNRRVEGFDELAPAPRRGRRVKLDPDEPCCDGPRRK